MLRSSPNIWFTRLLSHLGGSALLFAFTGGIAHAEPLQAGIEHTVQLPSVSEMMRPGARFNLKLLDEESENLWVKIPSWLAGKWLVEHETTVFHENFRTGHQSNERTDFAARAQFAYGHQKDSEGTIWHYLGTPYTSKTELSTFAEYHRVASKEVTEEKKSAVVKSMVTVYRVNNLGHQISKTFQQESFTTYTYVGPDELSLQSSSKIFDALGSATDLARNEARVTRLAPFTPIDSADGKDYRELFRAFLVSHGLERLIPESLGKAAHAESLHRDELHLQPNITKTHF